jgi:hypothetical protein
LVIAPSHERRVPCGQDVVGTDRDHAAELPRVPAHGVDPRGPGLEIALAEPVQRHDGLLLDRLHRHPAQGLMAGGFQERPGVGPLGLVPVAVASGVPRMEQRHLMPPLLELAAPVMRRAAGLQQDLGGRVLGEEGADACPGPASLSRHAGAVAGKSIPSYGAGGAVRHPL